MLQSCIPSPAEEQRWMSRKLLLIKHQQSSATPSQGSDQQQHKYIVLSPQNTLPASRSATAHAPETDTSTDNERTALPRGQVSLRVPSILTATVENKEHLFHKTDFPDHLEFTNIFTKPSSLGLWLSDQYVNGGQFHTYCQTVQLCEIAPSSCISS